MSFLAGIVGESRHPRLATSRIIRSPSFLALPPLILARTPWADKHAGYGRWRSEGSNWR